MARELHCWADRYEEETKDCKVGSPQWLEAVDRRYNDDGTTTNDATCFLPAGHSGAHEWTPDSGIVVEFAPIVIH